MRRLLCAIEWHGWRKTDETFRMLTVGWGEVTHTYTCRGCGREMRWSEAHRMPPPREAI